MYYSLLFFLMMFFSIYGAFNFFGIIYKALFVKKDKSGVRIYYSAPKQ